VIHSFLDSWAWAPCTRHDRVLSSGPDVFDIVRIRLERLGPPH